MKELFYRADMDEVRKRMRSWWNGGDLGRPAMHIIAPRSRPIEDIPAMPQPDGWVTDYSTTNFDYRVNLGARACLHNDYIAEAVPATAPDLAPNCLALYLGCHGVELPGTVWCEPCIASPATARFRYDPENFYWQFSMRLGQELLRLAQGKFLISFPDLIEGLDTLAAMRGTEQLLADLIERPDWVHQSLRQITDRYFDYYDILYAMFQDEAGGSIFWAWAPGRMAKFQCDCSAMISPEMFREFMVPVLTEMTDRVAYCMYHLDGPGALQHHDLLLSLPGLSMLQWTPGAGHEPQEHQRWWPLYHKTIAAGKKVFIGCDNMENLKRLKNEFGEKLKAFLISMPAESPAQAEEILKTAAI